MIVVHMFRIRFAAHRADAALLGEKLLKLLLPYAVAPPQVVLPVAGFRRAPIPRLRRLASARAAAQVLQW
jgi:hypothetical protein